MNSPSLSQSGVFTHSVAMKWTYKKYCRSQAAFNHQQKAINEEMEEIASVVTLLTVIFEEEEEEEQGEVKKRSKARKIRRNTIEEIYEAYGSDAFKRAYRMSYVSFNRLHGLLFPDEALMCVARGEKTTASNNIKDILYFSPSIS